MSRGIVKRLLAAMTLAGALALGFASSAGAFIYWADYGNDAIGRANNDGSGVIPQFITGVGDGPGAVAVDGAHIYWANKTSNSIGRANLDGTGVDDSFIAPVDTPSGVAVTGSLIFWTSLGDQTVGRANIDGSSPDFNLISGTTIPCGVAVDAGHVYWTEDEGSPSYIGRAPLNGSSPTHHFVNIPGTSFPCGVAVNTANIFWTDPGFLGGGTNIGRANVNTGMGADASIIGDADEPCGVAVDSSAYLLWANYGSNTIGRAKTDTTQVNQSFIQTGGNGPCGVAVNSLLPPNRFTIGKAKLNRKMGTAKLPVRLPGEGALTLTGNGVKRRQIAARAQTALAANDPRTVKLKVTPTGSVKRKLARKGKAKVTVKVSFTPTGGTANSKSKTLTLKKRG